MKKENILRSVFTKLTSKNASESLSFFNEVKQIRLKARLSLFIVWGSAAFTCGLFIFFLTLRAPRNGYVAKSALLAKIQNEFMPVNDSLENDLVSNRNDAFVFVHLNKKIFLTRFPSGNHDEFPAMPVAIEEASRPKQATRGASDGVIRKTKTATRKKSTVDFTIKPVPQ